MNRVIRKDSGASSQGRALVHEDYALSRVPGRTRYGWFHIAVQRFGQVSALSQFLVGAALGYTMDFWSAFWAITLGALILEIVALAMGIMGMKEGLNTTLLSRWVCFGSAGSALIGLLITVSLLGWFGIQTSVAAKGITSIIPAVPEWGWVVISGAGITLISVAGFQSMQWVANVTVPLFLLLVGWSVFSALQSTSLAALIATEPAGPPQNLLVGTAIVAGGFIVGAIFTPDMTRFNRNSADVVKQTLVGIGLGEYLMCLSGVLLALATRSKDVNALVISSVGWVSVLIIVAGTIKINDWNLYSAGLGVVNFFSTIWGVRLPRPLVTAGLGAVGTALAAAGILGYFENFLIATSVAFPPLAGTMVCEYFLVRNFRAHLERSPQRVPAYAPRWVPVTLGVWLISTLVGVQLPWGVGPINALICSIVLYWCASKLGWVRAVGRVHVTVGGQAEPAGSGAGEGASPCV